MVDKENTEELVEYFVVNKDLQMSKGKTAAQVAHVATIIAVSNGNTESFKKWFSGDQKKIILEAHEKDLRKLIEKGAFFIEDLGFTEIPEGSLTCVGLPPMTRTEALVFVKRLQLLK